MDAAEDLLNPVLVKSKTDIMVERVVALVKTGQLKAGDQLPPERRIAEEAGVSRAIVREALCALQLAGVVERKGGAGSFVAVDIHSEDLIGTSLRTQIMAPDPYDVWIAREAFEPSLAYLITENATDTDLAELRSLLAKLESCTPGEHPEEFFEADESFHASLARASHNNSAASLITSLLDEMRDPLWREIKASYYLVQPENVVSSKATHREILMAVEKRDPKAYKKAMERHFHELDSVLEFHSG